MEVKIPTVKCLRCGHEWPVRTTHPKRCRKCGSYQWDKPKEPKP